MKKALTVWLFMLSYAAFSQNCKVNGPIKINPLGTTELTFEVSGLVNDDLSSNLQNLCLVELGFEHRNVSTLEVDIVSPNGDVVKLVGQGNVNSLGSTQFITWNVVFAASSYPALPDPGFGDSWDNSNAWAAFSNYGGRYYPYGGNLEDMNTGSANGTWRLIIEDFSPNGKGVLNYAAIQFCDNTGLECDPCFADAGYFDAVPSNVFCANDPVLANDDFFSVLNANTSYNAATFNYALVRNDDILSIQDDLDIVGLAPGDYKLCGVINRTSEQLLIDGFTNYNDLLNAFDANEYCGDAMVNCLDIRIEDPDSEISKQDFICPGEVITIDGLNFYQETDTIIYNYTPTAGCESAIRYTIEARELSAEIISSSTMIGCNQTLILNGNNSVSSTGNIQYNWSTESGSFVNNLGPVVTIDAPGLYTLEVSDGDCSDITTIVITPDNTFDNMVTIEADSLGCDNSVVTLEIDIIGTYESLNWEGPGITDPTELEPIVSEPGEYSVTITSTNPDCPEIYGGVYVAQSNLAPEPLFSNFGELNCNESLIVEVVNQIDAVEAAWVNADEDTISRSLEVNITEPGDYEFIYTDAFGCQGMGSISVDGIFDEYEINYTLDSLSCNKFEGQIFTEVDGDVDSYFWAGPGGFFSNAQNPEISLPGFYRLTMSLPNGCTVRDTVEMVYDESAFNMFAPFNNKITCNDREIEIAVFPGGPTFEYSWEKQGNNTVIGTSDVVTVADEGIYFVTITRPSDNCAIQTWTFVDVDTMPRDLNFDLEKIDCDSDSIILDSDIENYALELFSWSGPDIDATNSSDSEPLVSIIGEYVIEGISDNGCEFMDTIIVEEDFTPINLEPQNQFILDCDDLDAVSVVMADREGTFTWTTPSGEEFGPEEDIRITLDITEIGSYDVHIVGSNGCVDDLAIDVVFGQAPPEVELMPFTNLDCATNEMTLTAVIGGDTDSFEWSHDASITTESTIIDEAGEYIITAFNDAGCMASDTALIEDDNRDLEFELFADTISCINLEATINIETEETDIASFDWTGPSGNVGTNPSTIVDEAGMYYLALITDDGCEAIDSIEIIADTMTIDFMVLPTDIIDCINDTITANIDNTGIDLTDVETIRWILDGNLEYEGIEGELANGGNYIVELVSSNGCVSQEFIMVEENKVFPTAMLTADTINCIQNMGTITAELSGTDPMLEWDGPDAAIVGSADLVINPMEVGEYSVTVTDENNCTVIETIMLEGDLDGPSTFANDIVISCDQPDQLIELENYDAATVTLMLNDPDGNSIDDPFAPITTPGLFELVAIGENGCDSKTVFQVLGDLDPPAATVDSSNINCINIDGEVCVLSIENIRSYEWSVDGSSLSDDQSCITSQDAGNFEVIITGENGCVDTLKSTIEIDTMKPVVNIAQNGIIGCESVEATLSGLGSFGEALDFTWSTSDGDIISGTTGLELKVGSAGTYNLALVDGVNGCENNKDYVVLDESDAFDEVNVSLMSPPCTGQDLGMINVVSVLGGYTPLTYSFDGGSTFGEINFAENLFAGDYNIVIKDSLGCVKDTIITLDDGRDIGLDLGDDVTIKLGESHEILPMSNVDPADLMVEWSATEEGFTCPGCWDTEVTPMMTTIYTVTVTDEFNCEAEDRIIIQVDDSAPVYVPNIFVSSGTDQDNIVVFNAGPAVMNVTHWTILDRWGNRLFRAENFLPGDVGNAWDGTANGTVLQPGVYMYIADVILINGDTRTIAGDITLMK